MLCLVVLLALGRAAADECPWHGCNDADNGDCYDKCRSCDALHTYQPHYYDSYGDCIQEHCDWNDDMWKDWYDRMIIGTILGAIVTSITLILASCPVCCGVMKDKPLKVFAIVLSLITIPCYFLPYIFAKHTTVGLVEDICNSCPSGCTQEEKTHLEDQIDGFSTWAAYTFGFGFVVVLLASITNCLSCCMCSTCCQPTTKTPVQPYVGSAQANVAQATVVGQPTGAADAGVSNKLAT